MGIEGNETADKLAKKKLKRHTWDQNHFEESTVVQKTNDLSGKRKIKIFVAVLYVFVVWQQVAAVVNNPSKVEDTNKATADTSEDNTKVNTDEEIIAAGTEEQPNRREASLSDSYGAPLTVPSDSYLPAEPSNKNLPIPIYGAPDSPSNNIVYPEPPPDIPPPITLPSPSYGIPSSNAYGLPLNVPPSNKYGPPNNAFGPPSNIYGPPSQIYGLPSATYGPPNSAPNYGPPKNTYGPPKFSVPSSIRKPIYGPPKFQYGPPGKPLSPNKFGFIPPYKSNFGFGGPKFPSKPFSTYGPPVGYFKDNYSPVKFNSNFKVNNFQSHGGSFSSAGGFGTKYGPPNLSSQYGAPDLGHNVGNSISPLYGVPSGDVYGPPKPQYGPPQPSPHPRPPHPGIPAPPTPPDIKYDGWQPIPGLVSKVPTPVYGAPSGDHQNVEADLSYNKDLSPPPLTGNVENHNSHGSVATLELESSYGPPPQKELSDSYGAPLNTVTGSGGIISASGEEAHGHGHHNHHDSHINVGLQAVGIGGQNVQAIKSIGYEIFPQGGAAISGGHDSFGGQHGTSYNQFNLGSSSHSQFTSHKSHGYESLPSSGIGLIPPSGVYGAPSGSYGTPLFTPNKIGPSKYPTGIQSSYLPPSKNYGPPVPSNLYGPSSHSAQSFQNIIHGSSSSSGGGYTSYNAPLNIVDGSYKQHIQTQLQGGEIVGIDYSHPGVTIDLTQGQGQSNNLLNAPHDCKSQSLPSLSYGVPSANSYTAALSSLTTNIGHSGSSISGSYGAPEPLPSPQAQIGFERKPHETYGVPDLTVSHSQKVSSEVKANSIETDAVGDSEGKSYGKTVAANFGPTSELVQSESIDFNNIPLQGSHGSYTLQIQSADGSQTQVPHGQVLNDGLLQSILAAIEQPKGSQSGQPIIQFQQSLEQQNFVTNDTLSSVVEQLTDAEIRHSTQLAKDDIIKTSEVTDSEVQYTPASSEIKFAYTSPNSDVEIQYSSPTTNDAEIQYSSPQQYIITTEDKNELNNNEENKVTEDESQSSLLQDNGIALYFSNSNRVRKETEEGNIGLVKSDDNSEQN